MSKIYKNMLSWKKCYFCFYHCIQYNLCGLLQPLDGNTRCIECNCRSDSDREYASCIFHDIDNYAYPFESNINSTCAEINASYL